MRRHTIFQVLVVSIIALLSAGCSASVSYKPPMLPVRLVLDTSGNISIVGDATLVTSIGEFSIGAQYTLTSEPDSITVIVRDRNKGNYGFDSIYRVRTGGDEFTAVLNGETTVQVANKQVLIDVTNANVRSIEFKRKDSSMPNTQVEKDNIAVTAIKPLLFSTCWL